jgi:hypothetical protein
LAFAIAAAPYGGRYLSAIIPAHFLGRFVLPIGTYRPAAPTGWKTTATRIGPDPYQGTAIRLAGDGSTPQ